MIVFKISAFENWLCFSEHNDPSGKKVIYFEFNSDKKAAFRRDSL